MSRHSDWSTPAFAAEPVAPLVGPFAGRGFLEAVWSYDPVGELLLVEGQGSLLPLVEDEDGVRWVGHRDLVDYRSPLGEAAVELLADMMSSRPAFVFDSLPEEAASVVGRGLRQAGLPAEPRRHEIAARVPLPGTFAGYLAGLSKKERHEIRRKRRRFEEEHGSPELVTELGRGEGFATFVRMHRTSAGVKGSFMTEGMERFFAALITQPGWRVELLYGAGGDPVAAAFVWADAEGTYLYNSAYDRRSAGSPGIVLATLLIERAIGEGRRIFDFLKGDEPYKFQLGAVARPLYMLTGSP